MARSMRVPGLLLVCLLIGGALPAVGQVSAGATLGSEGLEGFSVAVGNYYSVPQPQVIWVRERLPYEEVPVAFFVASRAHVAPAAIVELRLAGRSWNYITRHYGLSPEIFYVPVAIDPGPPYGRAYGYYKKVPRARWGTIRLADADVVNLVNLRFLAGHHRVSPDDVIRARGGGADFLKIHGQLSRGGKPGRPGAAKTRPGGGPGAGDGRGEAKGRDDGRGPGKGKGQGKGHGKGGKPGRG